MSPGASAAHAARPRGRTGGQRLLIGAFAVLTVCCLLAAVAIGYGVWKIDQIHRDKIALQQVADGAPTNYLVVGSDSRDAVARDDPNAQAFGASPGERSDTIMVVRIDPHNEKVAMLSLPRDLWLPIAGHNMNERINSAYGFGKQTLVDTVQAQLKIPINHYIEVNFKGFEGMVEAVGGVPMYFDTPMHDPHSGLEINAVGCTVLDGSQALAFARSRDLHYKAADGTTRVDGTGDLGRIARQQHFMRRALTKALTKATNPVTLNNLVDVGVNNVSIDSSLTVSDLLGLARRFSDFNPAKLETVSLPVAPFSTAGGAEVLKTDEVLAKPVLDRFRDPVAPVNEGDVRVTVLNGTNDSTLGVDVAGALHASGFQLTRWGNGSEIGLGLIARTQIRYGESGQEGADLLARHLTAGADLVADAKMAKGEIVLVAGEDFTTVDPAARPPGTAAGTPTATGASGTDASGSTTTTAPVGDPGTITKAIGRVPGDAPPGVTCKG